MDYLPGIHEAAVTPSTLCEDAHRLSSSGNHGWDGPPDVSAGRPLPCITWAPTSTRDARTPAICDDPLEGDHTIPSGSTPSSPPSKPSLHVKIKPYLVSDDLPEEDDTMSLGSEALPPVSASFMMR